MHMKVVEDSKDESHLRPFHCGRKELGLSKLNGFLYILTVTIFNTNLMDSIGVNNYSIMPRSRETVPALLTMMSKTKHGAKCG